MPREKIVFRGAQGFYVPGYLQLPPNHAGPVPCVLLLHGWSGSKEHFWIDNNYISGGNVRRALLDGGFCRLGSRRAVPRRPDCTERIRTGQSLGAAGRPAAARAISRSRKSTSKRRSITAARSTT